MRARSGFAVAFAFFIGISGASRDARAQPADEIDACANAAEESQPLKNAGKLAGAREKLLVCARPVCPAAVQRDCTKWLADIERVLPTIVLRVTDSSGRDITRVRVLIDGQPVAERLDGRPIPVDPGEHTFTYEAEGESPVTETLLIRQGEKDRLVSASFGAPKETPADPAPPVTAPPPPEADRGGGGSSVPTLSWVLGGVGVVALGTGAVLWASGTSDHSSMESGCARTQTCPQADVDSAKAKLLIGDIAMAAGLVAIGAGVVLAVVSKNPSPPATSRLDVKMVAGGGVATFGGRF